MSSSTAKLTLACLALGLLVRAPRACADCGQPVSAAELVGLLEKAEWAYGDADLPGFSAATEAIRTQLPCASEQIPRDVAARLHRAVGLRGFVDRDPDASTRAFAAARSIEPAYTFPSTMVPEGNPVWADYNAVPVEMGAWSEVSPPADGTLVFDGRPGTSRPGSWPSIVQFRSAQGEITDTLYLWPDQPLPVYEVATGPVEPPPLPGAPRPSPRRVSVPVLAAAGGLGVGSIGLLLASRGAHQAYDDPGASADELDALRARHNTLVWASRGTAAGAAVLGAGAFLVVRW